MEYSAPCTNFRPRGHLADSNGQGSVRCRVTAARWVQHPRCGFASCRPGRITTGLPVIRPQSEASSKQRFRSRRVIEKMVTLTSSSWKPDCPVAALVRCRTLCRVDAIRRIETCVSILKTRAARYSERADRAAGLKLDYGRGRSSSTTSECSCTRSRTTSRPSGEMSKSRMSKSGVRLVNCRSAPVSRSMSQRFLC
jgi:hypothetical protein